MFREARKPQIGIKQTLARFLPKTSGKIKQSKVLKEAPHKMYIYKVKTECKEYKSIK